jgi:hypothetical protein
MPDYRQSLLATLRIFKWCIVAASPWFALFGIGVAGAGRKMGSVTQEYVGSGGFLVFGQRVEQTRQTHLIDHHLLLAHLLL